MSKLCSNSNFVVIQTLIWFKSFFFKWFFFLIELTWYLFINYIVDLNNSRFNIWAGGYFWIKRLNSEKTKLSYQLFLKSGDLKFTSSILFDEFCFVKYNLYDFLDSYTSKKLLFWKIIFFKYNYKTELFYFFISTRTQMRLKQTSLGFYTYANNLNIIRDTFTSLKTYLFVGSKFLWKGVKFWILPISLMLLIIYFGLISKVLPFNKVVFVWIAFSMIIYWLISGFVFFFKKYQYGKYTSVIQRFWRRSYILFWLLESSLLLVFVYLTFIASQESFYMFDEIQIYKTHLFSWKIFFLKIFPIVILLLLAYFFLLTIKWNIFPKHSVWLLLFTFILTYVIWLEFYQFYHITNFYGNLVWNYDGDERMWNLELEIRRTRIVNHYIMWLLILKFWHLLFVYVFWIFFILRNMEKTSVRYPLYAANQQNLIILFLMNWLYMFPWIKIYFRKFLDMPYFWFYVNNRNLLFRLFFNDIKIFWDAFFTKFKLNFLNTSKIFISSPFFYWIETNKYLIYNQTKKHFIRNQIINIFNIV